ncbi:hypothetical protein FB451DRAFT_1169266 [Mycena latifolia]|nr:hypothetical protein FB451DRAFT_1169266 [Mycena latifolia]
MSQEGHQQRRKNLGSLRRWHTETGHSRSGPTGPSGRHRESGGHIGGRRWMQADALNAVMVDWGMKSRRQDGGATRPVLTSFPKYQKEIRRPSQIKESRRHRKNISAGIGFLLSPLPVLPSLYALLASDSPEFEEDEEEYAHPPVEWWEAAEARRRGERCVVYAAYSVGLGVDAECAWPRA